MYGDLISSSVDFDDDLVRAIRGIRESQDLYSDLGDDPEDSAVAAGAAAQDTPASHAPLITRPFEYGTVITYPFVPMNWQSTRFSDGLSYGAWYGSLDLTTAVYETAHYFRLFIRAHFPHLDREIQGDHRVFRVRCRAILIDLREKHTEFPELIARHSYRYTQQLGRYLRDQHQNGLLVRSARCEGANAAIFNPEVLSGVNDLCALSYFYNPGRDDRIRIEKEPGRPWLAIDGREIAS